LPDCYSSFKYFLIASFIKQTLFHIEL